MITDRRTCRKIFYYLNYRKHQEDCTELLEVDFEKIRLVFRVMLGRENNAKSSQIHWSFRETKAHSHKWAFAISQTSVSSRIIKALCVQLSLVTNDLLLSRLLILIHEIKRVDVAVHCSNVLIIAISLLSTKVRVVFITHRQESNFK